MAAFALHYQLCWGSPTGTPDLSSLFLNSMLTRHLRVALCICLQVCASYGLDRDQAERAASAEPAGTDGVTFLPFLGGERTPNWPHATGTILGLHNGQLRPGLIIRAAMEGITFLLADGMDELKSRGLRPEELRLVGGAARSTLWRQIIADVLQIPVLLPVETEAAALGGALQVS